MTQTRYFIFYIIFLTSPLAQADEIIDDNVTIQQQDVKQSQHWSWCGKQCRNNALNKAHKVLRRLDNIAMNYESSKNFYEDASDIFKKKASLQQWGEAINVRKKLGNPIRRAHESTQGIFRHLPNVDKDKNYVIVTYDTMFEREKGVYMEQVTLTRGSNNKFKFVGYYYNQKPYYEYK